MTLTVDVVEFTALVVRAEGSGLSSVAAPIVKELPVVPGIVLVQRGLMVVRPRRTKKFWGSTLRIFSVIHISF